MPDSNGNPTIAEFAQQSGASPFNAALAGMTVEGVQPFINGPLGNSGLTQAGINQFKQSSLPLIQQQLALQGLGQSPIVGSAVAGGLAQALPSFIQNDMSNRLQALSLLPQQQSLTQNDQQLQQNAAQISGNLGLGQQQLQLQALGQAGNILNGMGNNFNQAGQLQLAQQQQALQGLTGLGDLQQQNQQNTFDANQADFLRRQGLAEQATSGLFGGSVLPPALSQQTKTSGGGK